jgi:DNA replication protein DnaC
VGAPGSGKTYCAHAIMKDIGLLPQVLYRRLWTESEFIGKVKSTFDTYGTPEKEIEYICDDDLIVFDDFGSTSPGEWKQEILFHFVNIRYISKKPTIITTNLYENDMREKLGHRTSSRMFSSSNTIINFGDADLRKDPEIG